MEDRADGSRWVANFARTGTMVLSTQRNDDAFAVHAHYRLVRSQSVGMARAKLHGRSGKGLWLYRRSRSPGTCACCVARRQENQRLERFPLESALKRARSLPGNCSSVQDRPKLNNAFAHRRLNFTRSGSHNDLLSYSTPKSAIAPSFPE